MSRFGGTPAGSPIAAAGISVGAEGATLIGFGFGDDREGAQRVFAASSSSSMSTWGVMAIELERDPGRPIQAHQKARLATLFRDAQSHLNRVAHALRPKNIERPK